MLGVDLPAAVEFAVRSTRAGSASFLGEIREAVSGVTPDIPLTQVRTLEDVYNRSMARTSFTLVMLAIAAGMAYLVTPMARRFTEHVMTLIHGA